MLTRRELLIGSAALAACARKPSQDKPAPSTPSASSATPSSPARTEHAAAFMARFAERTGLPDQESRRRYLWTDAFAVRNFLALHRATGASRWSTLATALVDRVHRVLAPARTHDPTHPTAAGLRIGKKLPERRADEPFDDELEWDRDGQYFHYLTQWMHALDEFARATRNAEASRWACELASAAHRAFVHETDGRKRMYWKMSVDLTRPLVSSMGHHDALDGYVTYLHLATSSPAKSCASLAGAIADMRAMVDPDGLTTADPLGIGGLLVDASRLHTVLATHERGDRRLLDAMVASAASGLQRYTRTRDLRGDADHRLAFRELGLAIGLAVSQSLRSPALQPHAPVREQIEAFWLDPAHRANDTWREHEDINEVMLATTLLAA